MAMKKFGAVPSRKTVQSIVPMPLYIKFKSIAEDNGMSVSRLLCDLIRRFVRHHDKSR